MFDLRAIRENPDAFKAAWNHKKSGLGDETVPQILNLDKQLREAKRPNRRPKAPVTPIQS